MVPHCASLYQPLTPQCPAMPNTFTPAPYHHHLPYGQVRDNMGHAIITAPMCDPSGCGEEEGGPRANYLPPCYKEGENEERNFGDNNKVPGNAAKRLREEDADNKR